MAIIIDSMIWVYYFDFNSPENKNISEWIKKILSKEIIIMPTIIPSEVGHNLYGNYKFDKNYIEDLITKWISHEHIVFASFDEKVMVKSLNMLKNFRNLGIGGRDCIILTIMEDEGSETIITNDKNILRLNKYHRINPIFNPPLDIPLGEEFNEDEFKKLMETQYP